MIRLIPLTLVFLINLHSSEKEIYLKSNDGCDISATINISSTNKTAFLEVHGLGSDKNEWKLFNSYIESKNIGYISIDLRGHGKSIKCIDKIIKYPQLSEADINNFIKDIETAYNYIKSKYPNTNIIPIGASIGANVIMKYFYKKPIKIVLLSPGIKYATFDITDYFKNTKAKILILTSENDTYSFTSTKVFLQIILSRKIKYSIILAKNGHGVEVFNCVDCKNYIDKIIDWVLN